RRDDPTSLRPCCTRALLPTCSRGSARATVGTAGRSRPGAGRAVLRLAGTESPVLSVVQSAGRGLQERARAEPVSACRRDPLPQRRRGKGLSGHRPADSQRSASPLAGLPSPNLPAAPRGVHPVLVDARSAAELRAG